jgi:hypothetical protein
MLVMRFYHRRDVVCLLEKNFLYEEGEEEVGQQLSSLVCLDGVREATNRGCVRVLLSINEFLIVARR